MFSHKCTRTYTFTCGRIKLQHVRFWVIQRIYHSHLQFTHHGIPMEFCLGLMHHGGYSSSVVSHTSKVLKTYCCVIRSVKNSTLQLILIGEDNFLTSTWWVYMRRREEYTSMCHMLYIIYTKYFFMCSYQVNIHWLLQWKWDGLDTVIHSFVLHYLDCWKSQEWRFRTHLLSEDAFVWRLSKYSQILNIGKVLLKSNH